MDATFPTLHRFNILVVRTNEGICYVSRHELHGVLGRHGNLWALFVEAYPKESGNYTANGDFLAGLAEGALREISHV